MKKEEFKRHALSLIRDGAKVCPLCHSGHLEFTTDDEHLEYILECRMCKVSMHSSRFAWIEEHWNHRRSDDPAMHTITRAIEIDWYDYKTDDRDNFSEEVETILNDTKQLCN